MGKTAREVVIEDLLREVKFSMTRDIVSATNYLKRAREIRSGKQAQRKAKREAHNNRWRKNYDTPITW